MSRTDRPRSRSHCGHNARIVVCNSVSAVLKESVSIIGIFSVSNGRSGTRLFCKRARDVWVFL